MGKSKILKNIDYVSVWDDYGEVWSKCKVNTETLEVYDIETVDADVDGSVLQGEYIILNGERHQVFDEKMFKPGDEYWDEEKEEWTFYWKA